jgi:hypothetical protein
MTKKEFEEFKNGGIPLPHHSITPREQIRGLPIWHRPTEVF